MRARGNDGGLYRFHRFQNIPCCENTALKCLCLIEFFTILLLPTLVDDNTGHAFRCGDTAELRQIRTGESFRLARNETCASIVSDESIQNNCERKSRDCRIKKRKKKKKKKIEQSQKIKIHGITQLRSMSDQLTQVSSERMTARISSLSARSGSGTCT